MKRTNARSSSSTRKRVLRRIAISLLVAAVAQYAVAVGLSLYGGRKLTYQGMWLLVSPGTSRAIGVSRWGSFGVESLQERSLNDSTESMHLKWDQGEWCAIDDPTINSTVISGPVSLRSITSVLPSWPRLASINRKSLIPIYDHERDWLFETGTGWPMISASFTIYNDPVQRRAVKIDGLEVNWWPHRLEPDYRKPSLRHQIIPLRIAWRGAIVNTGVYAIPLLLYFLLRHLRPWLRLRRGQCVTCGYDLRGADHAVCPECGVPPDSASAQPP